MKKLLLLNLVALCLLGTTSCEKDPDTDKLDNDYLVYTNYDKGTDFGSIETFHVIDSILIISDQAKPGYWKNNNSQTIIKAYTNHLEERGYTAVANNESADMVLQISYISNTYYFNAYDSGAWWNSYPGYWNWGGWGWYYPFNFVYSYSTGSIIAELVSTTPSTIEKDKLTVIWNSYICGLLNGNSLSLSRTLNGINQAFDQSPYIKAGN
ncbi:MAG: DUF4136 domain-containing protein [Bacteroidales bacterium]|nr:DUF4136 domain-containing protein [Bacteroidales bacterium]